jgi:L-2,4-diaminobutyrate decarboxylase
MDPHAAFDPEAFRAAAHQVVDRLADHLCAAHAGKIAAHPNLKPLSAANDFMGPMPTAPAVDPARAILAGVDRVLADSMQVHHPGCMGHQVAAPLPVAVLADFVAGFLNQGLAVFETGQVAALIERQTVRWLADAIGWDDAADGVFTSGGSLGNLTALLAARNLAGDRRSWKAGVASVTPLFVLVSAAAHYSLARATAILGLGEAGVVPIATDALGRMDLTSLAQAAEEVEARGGRVMAVVGSACTTATGSYDPLHDIGAFCQERGYWFHVDGAHGASVLLSSRYRYLAKGIELADSVVWDAHKLLGVPGLATAVLFRRRSDNYAAFSQEASYLFNSVERDFDIGLRTLECTKRMLAYKLWLNLKVYGADALGDMVAGVHDRAREFASMLEAAPDFELYLPPESNIVCFRHRPPGVDWSDEALDNYQASVRAQAIASGRVYLVQTRLAGQLYLRVTIMNPLTSTAELDELLATLRAGVARPAVST